MNPIPRPLPTIIKDNFFSDPDRVREWALQQEFLDVKAYNEKYGLSESWPGRRSPALSQLMPDFFQDFISEILNHVLRLPPCNFKANSSFQLCYQDDGDSWIHMDDKLYAVAGLVYLTPDPPKDSGTILYTQRGEEEFEVTDVVGNRYNRIVLYDSQTFHKSNHYFGSSKETGRLTIPYFIEYQLA